MDTYEIWLLIVCLCLVGIAFVSWVISNEGEWKHLNNCKRTREGMERMIKHD